MEAKPISTEILHKEIDLIQSCISRMSQNSYALKGWFLTIIAAILALFNTAFSKDGLIIILAFFDACFWGLDAFYLKQERLYRRKYKWVIENRLKGNMDCLYDLDPQNCQMWLNDEDNQPQTEEPIGSVMFSGTLLLFYGIILIFSILYIAIEKA